MKKKNIKILLVDDEPDVIEIIKFNLDQEGYQVKTATNGSEAVKKAKKTFPHLIIMDVMMPELNGLQLCRIVRSDATMKNIPIIFLTARGETEDRIKGLEIGADDYLSKPFHSKELLLRIDKILNRGKSEEPSKVTGPIEIGGVCIDEELHQLLVDGVNVELTATEFRLLKLLMERKGRVQSRENLLMNVWNYDSDIETRTVDTHVRRVREKLGSHGAIIQTVRGVGYRAVDL